MIHVSGVCAPTGVLSSNPVDMGPGCVKQPIKFAPTAFDYLDTPACPITDGHTDTAFAVERMHLQPTPEGLYLDAILDVPRELVERFTGLSVSADECVTFCEPGHWYVDDVSRLAHIAFCTAPKWSNPAFPQTRFVEIREL